MFRVNHPEYPFSISNITEILGLDSVTSGRDSCRGVTGSTSLDIAPMLGVMLCKQELVGNARIAYITRNGTGRAPWDREEE